MLINGRLSGGKAVGISAALKGLAAQTHLGICGIFTRHLVCMAEAFLINPKIDLHEFGITVLLDDPVMFNQLTVAADLR